MAHWLGNTPSRAHTPPWCPPTVYDKCPHESQQAYNRRIYCGREYGSRGGKVKPCQHCTRLAKRALGVR